MAHASGNPTWTNTATTPITAQALENLESTGDYSVPILGNMFQPSDNGLISWSIDPAVCTATDGLGSNTIFYVGVKLGAVTSVTGTVIYIQSPNSSLVSGQNYAGLYDSGGTLQGTSGDQTTAWASNGSKFMPFTGGPKTLNPGRYTIALLLNSTTGNITINALPGYGQPMYIGESQVQWRSAVVSTAGVTALPTNMILANGGLNLWWGALY